MQLTVSVTNSSYPIYIERGLLSRMASFLPQNRKVMIISDTGVPQKYVQTILQKCKHGYSYIVEQGKREKSLAVYEQICREMLERNFTRKDMVIALGGGVIGDLSGFVAATFLRGIAFINIPTTTLSQIDSSIGGKVAVNLAGVKNILGAFYQPQAVFIDPDTLQTLPERHFYNGLAEALKAGLIADKELFTLMEKEDCVAQIEEIIYRSLLVKKHVVEIDEKEQKERKLLNFGHTIGHGVESAYGLHDLLHGEAVAVGMMAMVEDKEIKNRMRSVYAKLHLPEQVPYNPAQVYDTICKDKKAEGQEITIIKLKEIGAAYLEKIPLSELYPYLKGGKA